MTSEPMSRGPARLDARDKVTGRAMFAADLAILGGLVAVIVRSDRARGRLVGVDATEALAVSGVVAVFTGKDCDPARHVTGSVITDHPILAMGSVRYYGEPVALVVAETASAAGEGAAMVRMDIDEEAPVIDLQEAAASTVRDVHPDLLEYRMGRFGQKLASPGEGNVFHEADLSWGDVASARSEADLVVTTTAHFPRIFPCALESYVASATWSDGTLDVVTAAQHPFSVRAELAEMFELPLARIRVTTGFVGGAYGSKTWTKIEPLACLAAMRLNRPVQILTDLTDSFFTARADAGRVAVTSGFESDGTLIFRDFDVLLDGGAYAEQSPRVLEKAVNRCFGPYRIPHLRVRGRTVYTNTVPASSYRGFGAPQGALAGETNLEIAARRLGLSGIEVRKRNLVARGERVLPRLRAMDADLSANLDELEALIGYESQGTASSEKDDAGDARRVGVGIACTASDAGALPGGNIIIRLHEDASVTLFTGASEMGQGSRTALATVAAMCLGLPVERISVVQGATADVPFERSTNASRTTTVVGLAVQRACDSLIEQLLILAAQLLQCEPSDLAYDEGTVVHPGQGGLEVSEVIRRHFGVNGGELIGVGQVKREGSLQELPPFWELGMVGAAVAVDTETGQVELLKLASVADVGKAMFLPGVEGQDFGAMVQGLGIALTEEMRYEGQQLSNADIVAYHVPRASDIPAGSLLATVVEREDGPGPFGSKGVGEGALNPVPAAVANAIFDALGVWPDEVTVPLTPERVLELIRSAD